MIVLFRYDPKLYQKCKARGLDPDDVRHSMYVKGHSVKRDAAINNSQASTIAGARTSLSCKSNRYQIPEAVCQLDSNNRRSRFLSSVPQNLLLKNSMNNQFVTSHFS